MITAFYIPDFQAWYRARYTQKPTIIIRQDRVIAATADLREGGVLNGDYASRVCRQFPTTVIHLDDPAYEQGARELIMCELNRASPSVTLLHDNFICVEVPTLNLARRITDWLRCRSGWAATDLAACFAALAGQVKELTAVAPGGEGEHIAAHPATSLLSFGFEQEIVERLGLFGYRTIGSLMKITRKQMHAQFGTAGIRLHTLLHGEPSTTLPSWAPPPTIEISFQFDEPVQEPENWLPILSRLSAQSVGMLNGMKATFARIVLDETESGKPFRYTIPLKHPSADAKLIGSRAQRMLQNRRFPPFSRMIVVLGGLVQQESLQFDLFETRNGLDKARRAILRRYPNGLLQFEEIDVNAPLPEDRWRYAPARS